MQLSLTRFWLILKDIKNTDLNSEFQNILQFWNDHNSGAKSWDTVNATNVIINGTAGSLVLTDIATGSTYQILVVNGVLSLQQLT